MKDSAKSGAVNRFFIKYCPYVLLAIPVIISETVATICNTAFGTLIGEYLLHAPPFYTIDIFQFVLLMLELLYCAGCFVFLLPVFKAHRRITRGVTPEDRLMLKARTRIYNFPTFLIMATVSVSLLEFLLVITTQWAEKYGPFIPFASYVFVAVTINAIVIYYLADTLNRFYFLPYWFPDGDFNLPFRLRSPGLAFRFLDMFMVTGLFPVATITAIGWIAHMSRPDDPDILRRVVMVSATIGGLYWLLGALLFWVNSRMFLLPLDSMEQATEEMGKGNYESRVVIHSDDQMGKLERAINDMGRALREKEVIKQVFGHYVSPTIRDMILGGRINTEGDRIEAVVLFSDIRSFTELSEQYPPEKIIKLLNIHFSKVVEAVGRNNGFVDKFIGDAVMAVFDAELTENMHRMLALKTAAEMMETLSETNREIEQLGLKPIRIGIGLACGTVIRGNVGSEDRRELTVIGNTVNLASRLEAATQELGYPIIATSDTFDQTCESIPLLKIIERKSFTVRGRSEPIEILGMTAG